MFTCTSQLAANVLTYHPLPCLTLFTCLLIVGGSACGVWCISTCSTLSLFPSSN